MTPLEQRQLRRLRRKLYLIEACAGEMLLNFIRWERLDCERDWNEMLAAAEEMAEGCAIAVSLLRNTVQETTSNPAMVEKINA